HDTPPPLFIPKAPPTSALYTLSLHDALPILSTGHTRPLRTSSSSPISILRSFGPSACKSSSVTSDSLFSCIPRSSCAIVVGTGRSEEHTSELQSRENLVCRLLLEKKNIDSIR